MTDKIIQFDMFEAAWFGIRNGKAQSMQWRKVMVSSMDQGGICQ